MDGIKPNQYIKLNHKAIAKLMLEKCLRPRDIMMALGVSKQVTNYILHHGGVSKAKRLSAILGCELRDILMVAERKERPRKKRMPDVY